MKKIVLVMLIVCITFPAIAFDADEKSEPNYSGQITELNRLLNEQRMIIAEQQKLLNEYKELNNRHSQLNDKQESITPPSQPEPLAAPHEPKAVQFANAWIDPNPYNGGYWIQVGAFQNQETVECLKIALQDRNFPVDTNLTTVKDGKILRRVRIGPYDRADAKIILKIISAR
jgi:cell division septation protein DedD